MAITLEFQPDDRGRKRYEICTQAFILTPRVPQLAEYEDVVSVLRKLKSIGIEDKATVKGTALYDLQDQGGTITLERSEWSMLCSYLKEPMWRASVLEVVMDTREWLDSFDPSRKRTHPSPTLVDG